MSVNEKRIAELEQQITSQQAEIERLKSEMYKASLLARGGIASATAGVKEIIEQADKDRQEYEGIITFLQGYVPLNAIKTPPNLPVKALEAMAQATGRPLTNFKNTILVDARIGVRYGEKHDEWEVHYIKDDGYAWFPGDRKSFNGEVLPRIMNLFHRSPLPENKGRAGLVGLPDEKMLDVMLRLSECRYNPDYEKHWKTRFDLLFETVIWPEVKEHYAYKGGKDTARNRALKEILRRFEHMEGEGRGNKK